MTTYFLEPRGRILDAAKQAAMDAVDGYEKLNPYTIGIAVQAAAAILRTDVGPPANRAPVEVRAVGSAQFTDAECVELSPRLQALESVADAARRAHRGSAHLDAEPCPLCAALRQLEQAG